PRRLRFDARAVGRGEALLDQGVLENAERFAASPDTVERGSQRLGYAKGIGRARRLTKKGIRSFEVPDFFYEPTGRYSVAVGSIRFEQALSERRVVLGVPDPQALCCSRIGLETFGAVLANRFEQRESFAANVDQAVVDKRLEALEFPVADALDRGQVESTG